MRYIFVLLLLQFFFLRTSDLHAQTNTEISGLNINDLKKISLPSLDVLFENARNNPNYELADVKEQIEINNFRKEKKAWLSYLSLRGS